MSKERRARTESVPSLWWKVGLENLKQRAFIELSGVFQESGAMTGHHHDDIISCLMQVYEPELMIGAT